MATAKTSGAQENRSLQRRARELMRRLPEEDVDVVAQLLDRLCQYEQFAVLLSSALGNASRGLPPTSVVDEGRSIADSLAALSTFGRAPSEPEGQPRKGRR